MERCIRKPRYSDEESFSRRASPSVFQYSSRRLCGARCIALISLLPMLDKMRITHTYTNRESSRNHYGFVAEMMVAMVPRNPAPNRHTSRRWMAPKLFCCRMLIGFECMPLYNAAPRIMFSWWLGVSSSHSICCAALVSIVCY